MTGDPWAGVAEDELFDMTPYAGAYVRYFVRHPTTQAMPRKVKTAFDGSPADRAICGIHDIAFRARVKQIDGREVRGAEMLVGGGTSIMPRKAATLYEFVELDNGEYLKIAEAVFRIFDRQEWLRVNRARARIKVFVDKYGIDELRNQVEEELKGDWVAERDFDPAAVRDRRTGVGARRPRPARSSPNGDLHEFDELPRPQRRRAASGGLRDGRGQDHPRRPHPRAVPGPGRHHPQLHRRLRTHHRAAEPAAAVGPRGERLRRLARARRSSASATAGPREINDVVSCPGHRLLQARDHELDGPQPGGPGADRSDGHRPTPASRRIHIKMSGCPNGCSQHHVADIGLYGASIKVGEHQIPAYIPHIGGRYEAATSSFGQRLKVRLPAKRVPDAIERWIRHYESSRTEGESFRAFAERVGTGEFEGLVKDLSMPVEFGLETMNQFIDWNRNAPFEVQRGEGECAV